MNHHVTENAARTLDIINRRRAGITRSDLDKFNGANCTGINLRANGSEIGIEAAVEADHQFGFCLFDDFKARAHAVSRKVNRLFAENRFSRARRKLDLVGMHIRWRTD